MKSLRGYFFILGATVFWGVSATIARFLFTREIDTIVLVQMRMTISCVILLFYFLLFKPGLLRVRAGDLYRFMLLGIIGGAGSNFTYYLAIRETNVATAILLQYLAPLFVLLYAAVTHEERLTFAKLGAGVVSLAGCFLAIGGRDFSVLSLSHVGLLAGLSSAFCWGFTNISLRRLLRDYNVWTCLIYAFLFASLFWLFINPPWKIIAAQYDAEQWEIFAVFAVISILIPHSLYFAGMRYLTASRGIITATFEPVVAIVSAFVLLHEGLVAVQIVGALLVLAAIAILQWKEEQEKALHGEPPEEREVLHR